MKKLKKRTKVADSMKKAFNTPEPTPEAEDEDSEGGFFDGLKEALYGKSRTKLEKIRDKDDEDA